MSDEKRQGKKKELKVEDRDLSGTDPSGLSTKNLLSKLQETSLEVIEPFLDGLSLLQLSKASKANRTHYLDAAHQALLLEIGPNLHVLINAGEKPIEANQRHLNIISSLHSLESFHEIEEPAQLAERLANYPHYYLRQLIASEDFERIIPFIFDLHKFITDHPIHTDRTMNYALSNPQIFARMLSTPLKLLEFVNIFSDHPEYVNRVIDQVMTQRVDFARVIPDLEALVTLKECLPTLTERAIMRIITSPADFDRVIKNKEDVQSFVEHFSEKFPQAVKQVQDIYALKQSQLPPELPKGPRPPMRSSFFSSSSAPKDLPPEGRTTPSARASHF